jgi:recombinational DNA repair protein (RecF pathway)
MAHRVYTTDGVVLRKEGVGEKSISALILTPEFGLLRVRAQSARGSEGKLRFALEPMTLGTFSFISGRFGARLVGAQAHEHLLPDNLHASRGALGNITRLLVRLLPGEEAHQSLFEAIVEGFRFMKSSSESHIPHAECALVLCILRELGYLPEDQKLARFAEGTLSVELLTELEHAKPHAVRTINQVLSSTGL